MSSTLSSFALTSAGGSIIGMVVICAVKQVSHVLNQLQIILRTSFAQFVNVKVLKVREKSDGIRMEFSSSKTQPAGVGSSSGFQTDPARESSP